MSSAMWWNIIVGAIVFMALVVVALWGIYGDKLRLPFIKREDSAKSPLPPHHGRKEPVFGGGTPPASQQQDLALDFTPPALPPLEEHWQADYCYEVRFYEEQVREEARFGALKEQLRKRHIKVYQLLGFDENSQQWSIAETASSFRYWIMMVPLADRSGSLSQQRIKLVEGDCRKFAEGMGLRVKFPLLGGALERAKLLDKFCNEVDVVLSLRVVFREPLSCIDAEELLRRSYMVANGNSYVYRLDSEVMFSASPVMLPNNMVSEILFVLDAPKVSVPRRAFEDMISCMEEIAELKHGKMYDRKEKELDETYISIMRGAVEEQVVIRMTEKGVEPGSQLAHLLFS